jgi:hypothetical protein
MIEPINRTAEDEIIDGIDPAEMEGHVDSLCGLERLSGGEDERKAAEYVCETLESYGVDVTLEEFEGYVSVPEHSEVEIRHPTQRTMESITVAFSASTPASGVHGELISVDADALIDETNERELAGKLLLVDSLPNPSLALAADEQGAAGLICLSPNEHHYEGSVSSVWGTPTPETFEDLPNLPVAELAGPDGEWLRTRLDGGSVEATLRTDVSTEIRTLPCPVGRIDGTESDRYFVVGNHIDSWHEGVTDNATAVATTLEIARLFADRKPKRGLVFGFWPAHSTGRYAGSAWYADTNWLDLRKNGVAYLHIDLPGLVGANEIWYQHMAEVGDEHLDIIREVVAFDPQEGAESYLGSVGRPARNSDQSFWGTGLSSLLSSARLTPGTAEGGPIGGGWWWHTPEDTRDKVDMDVLVEETKLYVALAARICESPVLPHDYTATVDDIKTVLDGLDSGTISFDPLYNDLAVLRTELTSAYDAVATGAETDHQLAAAFEDLQVELGNLLIPAVYMTRQEYEHEPKGPHRLLEELQPVATSTEQGQRFAGISCQRGVTRLQHRVRRATRGTQEFRDQHATDGRGSRQHEA